jgi:transcriptional regulator with XRE-family HTH domain
MKLYSHEHFAVQRRRDNLSQREIARRLDVTQGFIAQVESGLRSLTKPMLQVYPKKLSSVKRYEIFWVLLRRAGISHTEAKKLFNVTARDFNDWMRGDRRVPDHAFDYAVEKAKLAEDKAA